MSSISLEHMVEHIERKLDRFKITRRPADFPTHREIMDAKVVDQRERLWRRVIDVMR